MELSIHLSGARPVILCLGHFIMAFAYLGIALIMRRFVNATAVNAAIIAQMFRLFSYFIAACAVQHILAVMVYIYPLLDLYILAVWATALLSVLALVFLWRLRPHILPIPEIVVVPS